MRRAGRGPALTRFAALSTLSRIAGEKGPGPKGRVGEGGDAAGIRPAIVLSSVERRRAAASLALLVFVLLAPGLAGCGKKDAPGPPPGAPNTYPRSYPRE